MNPKSLHLGTAPNPIAWECSSCGRPFPTREIAYRCCSPESAQDAMNRQQEEIKELLIESNRFNRNFLDTEDWDDAHSAIDRIIQVLAKMNGVEDVLK